ncbi:Fe-S cluster assembly ATPase SufC [Candidatus Methanosphaera massiliense]|jgi:Fe-S cluster assembly ATP-binding protein|uniref:Fe-S cluster assembly ATPase SufC n=1 Tax=Methanosphaera TaxID=2316 RepID=UPI000DC27E3F|nr:Fe-S cluster assembly ATPase SufC [Candidatus Methanosphaera massiliense]MDD6285253.1 Fe-S cluster assembly ATPase SufC [Methanobacteriaceae archaeon]MDE4078275.1 Fe-S cluster assembly ATPase SufC [Candidatus Methanosphaera massiliense]MDY2745225.1 Fe-S cluster assembly ATPase SufC [Methanosphaera sp.]RAP44452.1 MAG: Fe-S cluster assembly ATPase SufC [Methanosphaera sp. SHI1033]
MLLEIKDLEVEVEGKQILKGVNLEINEGERHVLLGPNGAGKSTLFMTILGFPKYEVTNGKIIYKGQDITNMETHERIKLGLGVTFQNPPAIHGVKLKDLLKIEDKDHEYKNDDELTNEVVELGKRLKLNETFLERDVNLGFSGGEVKRSELLQLLAQKPDFIMFDEPDSGVDIENVELISKEIGTLLGQDDPNTKKSGLLITHLGYILKYVNATHAHILIDGKITRTGNPTDIMNDVRKSGFGDA